MDRRVTPPTWGPPPPCKQALREIDQNVHENLTRNYTEYPRRYQKRTYLKVCEVRIKQLQALICRFKR